MKMAEIGAESPKVKEDEKFPTKHEELGRGNQAYSYCFRESTAQQRASDQNCRLQNPEAMVPLARSTEELDNYKQKRK